MSQIKFIDSYASIGKWWDKDPDHPWTVEKMLKDMERCQIHGALVYSNLAKELQPSTGNEEVLRVCQGNPRLFPVWVALPDHCGDFMETKKFIQEISDNKVKAVKIFPRSHRYPVDEATLGELLHALEEAGIPLIVDKGLPNTDLEQVSWQEVGWICQKYPRLKVILHSVRWEATRTLLPIMKNCPNLFVEFSDYQANRIIEFLVKEVGADQLLFGTQMMLKSPGAAKAFILYADISEEDRRKIAGENLARILKLDKLPEEYSNVSTNDKILQKARAGEPIDDMEVIDAHAHHYPKNHFDNAVAFMPESDAAGIVERNKRIGVNITCSSPWVGIWTDWEKGNLDTRDAIKDLPDDFIGYAAFDPRYVRDWDAELKKCYEDWGMKGMKPYFPRNHVPYNDPVYNKWYEYGNKKRLFALMHWSDNFDQEMDDLARRFPEISFLLAHSGMTYERAKKHIRLAKKFKNIFLEITYTAVTNGIIEYMVDQVGASRVIYGSDSAMRDPIPQFGWVAFADISEEEKRLILGKNMRKILDRVLLKNI